MIGFLKKAFNLLSSPTHSRTTAILVALILLAAIPLTVIVSQKQQELRQRAAEPAELKSCTVTISWDPRQFTGYKRQILFSSGPVVLIDNLNHPLEVNDPPYIDNSTPSTYTFRSSNVVPGTYTFHVNDYPEGSVHSVEVTADANCTFFQKNPTPSQQSTSSQTPTSSACSYDNINSCVADKNCAWGKLSGTNPTCYSFGNKFQCPTGFEQWYWQDSKTNECTTSQINSSNPTSTPTSTPTLIPRGGFISSTPTIDKDNFNYVCEKDAENKNTGKATVRIGTTGGTGNMKLYLHKGGQTMESVPWTANSIKDYSSQIAAGTISYQIEILDSLGKSIATSQEIFPNCPTPSFTSSPDTPTPTIPQPTIIAANCSSFTDTTSCFAQKKSIDNTPICGWCVLNNGSGACVAYGSVCPQQPIPPTAQGETILVFQSFNLEGITDSNNHNDQNLTIYLYKSTDDPKSDIKGNNPFKKNSLRKSLKYNISNRNFSNSASVNLGKIDVGSYKVLVKSDQYLRRLVDAVTIPVNGGTINIANSITLFAGDADNNNVLNIQDYEALRSCFESRADTPSCTNKEAVDFNDDGKVDGLDYLLFIKNLSLTERQGD